MSRTRIINSKARKLKVGENAGNGAWVEDAAPRPNDRSGDSPSASSSSIEFITTPRRAFPRGAITRVARAPQTASPPRRTLALPRALLAAATFAATARHALATEALISHDLPREDSVTTSPASFEARGRVFRARKSGATVANDTRTRSVTLSELADCLLQLRRRESCGGAVVARIGSVWSVTGKQWELPKYLANSKFRRDSIAFTRTGVRWGARPNCFWRRVLLIGIHRPKRTPPKKPDEVRVGIFFEVLARSLAPVHFRQASAHGSLRNR